MTIAVIGTGNMGSAIVRGFVRSGACCAENIICTAKSIGTLERIRSFNDSVRTTNDNAFAAKDADVIILAVKPWLIEEILMEIRPVLDLEKQVIVSVAAGVTLDNLLQYTTAENSIQPALFRVVPNTAVEVLCGVTFIASSGTSAEQREYVYSLFSSLGYTLEVDEKLIPAATALASCGIAFAMRYMRANIEGGVELGFHPEEAARIVEHTVHGAATLLLHKGNHPEVEIDKVTTARGITIKGLNAMEKAGFTAAIIDGLKASK